MGSLKRRDFIRSMSLAGASMALSGAVPAPRPAPDSESAISNNYFNISFDRKKGTFTVRRNNGSYLIDGGTCSVNFLANARSRQQDKKRSSDDGNFRYKTAIIPFDDNLGSGKKMIVVCSDRRKITDLEIQLALYDKIQAFTIEAFCKNVSGDDIVVHSLEPIRLVRGEGGFLHVPGVSKCITNGEMYFDTGIIHQFGSTEGAISSGDVKGVTLTNGPLGQSETIHSWWNAGFFSGYNEPGVSLGYVKNDIALGNLLISRSDADVVSVVAESVYAPRFVLSSGSTVRSNPVVVNVSKDPFTVLEEYADFVGTINEARTRSTINGWSSWFYTLAQVSEEEVIANIEFAAMHLKRYGLEYIQIDEGYQRWHGDWNGNERFPKGMKWLADTIRSRGFKAGIWISPYVISEPAEVFQKHPEWMVRRADGSLQRVGNWPQGAEPPADENPKRYCLDITHPGAEQWLHDLIRMIAIDWGYEMIKIDFVAWSILAAERYHDTTISSAQVYRKGMEIMRKAAGDHCHILECGPGAITVGLVDSMRIELDVNYGFSEAAWDTYFVNPASSMSAAGKRYYFHKRTWINDIDHLCMDMLDYRQSEAAATLIAMSGGNTMSGDRLTQLDPYKLEILKKITPSSGIAATPVDLFDSDRHSIFATRIMKQFGEWTVAAFFNASLTEDTEKTLPLERLWLNADKQYLAFDFWSEQYIGEVTGSVLVAVPRGSVRLLTLHEKLGHPQFLSTDRHAMQGAVEIEKIEWNEATKILSGTSIGPKDTSHNVFVYVPGEHPWTWGGYVLYHDEPSYSLRLVHSNIIRIHVRFNEGEKVDWKIDCNKFFEG